MLEKLKKICDHKGIEVPELFKIAVVFSFLLGVIGMLLYAAIMSAFI